MVSFDIYIIMVNVFTSIFASMKNPLIYKILAVFIKMCR